MYVLLVDAFWKIILKPQNDSAIAQVVSGQLLIVVPWPVNVGFVVDKGKVFSEFLDFPPPITTPPNVPCLSYTLWGRYSEVI
jgi:hypothetical protein